MVVLSHLHSESLLDCPYTPEPAQSVPGVWTPALDAATPYSALTALIFGLLIWEKSISSQCIQPLGMSARAQPAQLSLELCTTTDNSATGKSGTKSQHSMQLGSYSGSCSPAAAFHQVFPPGMKIILFLRVKVRIPTPIIAPKTEEGVFKIAAISW